MKIIKEQAVRNLTEARSCLRKDTPENKQKAQVLIKSAITLLGKL